MNAGVLTHKNNKLMAKWLLTFLNTRVAKPSFKAFVFAYLYITLPKIINHIIAAIKKNDYHQLGKRISKVIAKALHPFKFPMFCASLIGCINILEPLVAKALKASKVVKSGPLRTLFVSTFISSFLASSISFPRFQKHIIGYGRFLSLDLTLLVFSRAIDTALSSSLAAILPAMLQNFGDGLLFIGSCTFIMYSWFFNPERLPPAYRKWITSAATMDDEMVGLLKGFHDDTLKYGTESHYLDEYCKRYNRDPKEGDLVSHQPVKCELVHAFQTENCELHGLWRFARGFKFAFKLYGGLNLFMLLFPKRNVLMILRLQRALTLSLRSSTFLGTYIGLYWYAVCLARTRLFPKLFPNVPMTRWDKTIAPTAGAVMCGFSSFVESAQRRKELALFVFPRAIGTLVPTEATPKNLLLERLVFSLSMAVLVAFCKRSPSKVRGIFGKGLRAVITIN